MTSSPPPGSRVAALPRQLSVAALSVLGLLACGGDDVSAGGPIGPSGAVELEFSGFLNDRGQVFAVDASEVTLSCDGSISVLFESAADGTLANWLLRPPGACESFDQCGYISLAALREGGNRVTTAGAATTLLMRLTPGVYSFEAKLLDGDGEEFLQDAEPVADTLQAVTLVAQDSCSSTTSASGGSGAGGASTSTGGSGGGGTTGSSGGAGGAAGALGLAGAAGADQLAGAGGQEG